MITTIIVIMILIRITIINKGICNNDNVRIKNPCSCGIEDLDLDFSMWVGGA